MNGKSSGRTGVKPILEALEDRRLMSAVAVIQAADATENAAQATVSSFTHRIKNSSALTATANGSDRVQLAWATRGARVLKTVVSQMTGASGAWTPIGTFAGGRKSYMVTGLTPKTQYSFQLRHSLAGGRTVSSNIATLTTPPASDPGTIVYSGPLVIKHGGTYSGNWESLDTDVPAVSIQTSEPVVIQNSNIRSRGTLIQAYGDHEKVTVRNTSGYGLNPNKVGYFPGRFLDVDGFSSIVVQNNYMENTSGLYLYNYQGNHSSGQTIKVLRNVAKNIDGRESDGNGGWKNVAEDPDNYRQFFQTNGLKNLVGAEVAWNQIINEEGKSRVEENINIHATTGTNASHFAIHDNYIQGAFPANKVDEKSYTGGGIMVSDNGSSFIDAYNNQVVATGSVGIMITSGHDNTIYNNRILASGKYANNSNVPFSNTGSFIWNFNHERTFKHNSGHGNTIGWVNKDNRNDWWMPDASAWTGNTSWPGAVTRATEAAEYTFWQNKLARAKMKIGRSAA